MSDYSDYSDYSDCSSSSNERTLSEIEDEYLSTHLNCEANVIRLKKYLQACLKEKQYLEDDFKYNSYDYAAELSRKIYSWLRKSSYSDERVYTAWFVARVIIDCEFQDEIEYTEWDTHSIASDHPDEIDKMCSKCFNRQSFAKDITKACSECITPDELNDKIKFLCKRRRDYFEDFYKDLAKLANKLSHLYLDITPEQYCEYTGHSKTISTSLDDVTED